MRRILILCEYPTLLGGERSMLATLPAVQAAGYEVHVAAPAPGQLADAIRQAPVQRVPWQLHTVTGARLPIDVLRAGVADLLRATDPQLIHANSVSMSRLIGPVAREMGISSIGYLRDILALSGQAVADVNANKRLIAVSHATREFHVAQGIDGSKCSTVHNGIDLGEYCPRKPTGFLHEELRLRPGARLIATIGQLGPRKGTDIVLSAAARIAAEVPNVHWLVVGDRTSGKEESLDFEHRIQSLARMPAILGRVHLLGIRNDVPRLLNECDLLVHGARQEPLGRVLLEAAASGVAVVATDVGGTREIFPEKDNGAILVPPDDVDAMGTAMVKLLRDEPRRRAMASAARRRAEQAFDIRNASRRLIEQYEAVLSE
jgi:glycosyltransferase involved in cell wall biosynthesis